MQNGRFSRLFYMNVSRPSTPPWPKPCARCVTQALKVAKNTQNKRYLRYSRVTSSKMPGQKTSKIGQNRARAITQITNFNKNMRNCPIINGLQAFKIHKIENNLVYSITHKVTKRTKSQKPVTLPCYQ